MTDEPTIEELFPDFTQWPERWEGDPRDVPYGEALIGLFRPFIADLLQRGLTRKTARRHMNNLWLLGGEIIREVCNEEDYDVSPEQKLRESIDEVGGRYCRHLSTEAEARAYDATCRALHRFFQK